MNFVIVCSPSKWFLSKNVGLLEVKKIEVISFLQVFHKWFLHKIVFLNLSNIYLKNWQLLSSAEDLNLKK